MFCQKCGKEIPNTANVCPYCGYNFRNNTTYTPTKNSIFMEEKIMRKRIIVSIIILSVVVISICIIINAIPIYSMTIKDEMPEAYSTYLTYDKAFNRYFTYCKWHEKKINSQKVVQFIGLSDNNNGTANRVEIIFEITDLDDGEFFYNIGSVTMNGVSLSPIETDILMRYIFRKKV